MKKLITSTRFFNLNLFTKEFCSYLFVYLLHYTETNSMYTFHLFFFFWVYYKHRTRNIIYIHIINYKLYNNLRFILYSFYPIQGNNRDSSKSESRCESRTQDDDARRSRSLDGDVTLCSSFSRQLEKVKISWICFFFFAFEQHQRNTV